MRSRFSIRLGLALALTLATGIVTNAQTNWPTTAPAARKVARVAAAPEPVQNRKPKPTRKRRAAKPVAAAAASSDLLRSMAELVTRQATAIEALGRRLEAAESRLEQLASAAAPSAPVHAVAAEPTATLYDIDDAQAPFRAALSIDWADLIGR